MTQKYTGRENPWRGVSAHRDGESENFSTLFLPTAESEREGEVSRQRVLDTIAQLGLQTHVGELERDGYTVLRPTEVGSPDFITQLRDTVLKLSEKRTGIRVNIETGETHRSLSSPFGQVQFESCLLEEDPIFERMLMHERTLALVTYLLGESCVLNHFSSMIKGPGHEHLPLHTDQNQSGGPPPFPPYAQIANATWILTDYTVENGCLCFVPGSHKSCRAPTREEAMDLSRFVPLEAPAGSVVIWHGNTWHGALRRTKPGVRVSLLAYFTRWYITPIEELHSRVTQEMLERNPPRFAILTGARKPVSHESDTVHSLAARTSLFA